MSKARDSVIVLECGCKLGGNKGGPYYYDYLCEKHVKKVQIKGKYDYDKAVKLTDELNRKVRKGELKID